MIDRVTESEWARWWSLYIGDKEVMIDRIIGQKLLVAANIKSDRGSESYQ